MTARSFSLDKSNAKLLGVCSGIADFAQVDATLVRIATVLLTIFVAGPLMLLAYLAIAMVANDKPM